MEAINDQDKKVLDQDLWEREGECKPGCGACCRSMILPLDPRLASARTEDLEDFRRWARLHGVRIQITTYDLLDGRLPRVEAYLPIQCFWLDDDGRCIGHEAWLKGATAVEKPNMCKSFPQIPFDLRTIEDVCTYKFKRREDETT